MKKIGIIAAMDVEMERILASVQTEKEEFLSGILFRSGRIGGREIILAKAGLGKVNAAVCAQTMIMAYHPELIINSGVAGYLSDKLPVAGVVIADKAVQHDMDTSGIGDPLGFISGLNKVFLPAAPYITEGLSRAAASDGVPCETGTVATGDQFVNSAEKSAFIRNTFGAAAAEMEGGAIAQVCLMNGVDFGILRSVSDNGNEDATADYEGNLRRAAEAASSVILAFCADPAI